MFKGILIEKGCADYRSALDEPNSDIFFLTAMRGIKQTPKTPAAGAEADSKGFIPGAKPGCETILTLLHARGARPSGAPVRQWR